VREEDPSEAVRLVTDRGLYPFCNQATGRRNGSYSPCVEGLLSGDTLSGTVGRGGLTSGVNVARFGGICKTVRSLISRIIRTRPSTARAHRTRTGPPGLIPVTRRSGSGIGPRLAGTVNQMVHRPADSVSGGGFSWARQGAKGAPAKRMRRSLCIRSMTRLTGIHNEDKTGGRLANKLRKGTGSRRRRRVGHPLRGRLGGPPCPARKLGGTWRSWTPAEVIARP